MKKGMSKALAAMMAVSSAAGFGTVASAEDTTYNVGVCQYVQHEALDAATQGFVDALTEKLGDQVNIDIQNASGDVPTCATIINQFVSNGADLIMANATPALQAAVAGTDQIPILGTSITVYSVALGMDDASWTGASGINVSGTSDLAPLDQQAAMFAELLPDVKTVGLLSCSAEPNSAYQVATVKAALEEAGLTCKEYTFADSNDLAAVTQQAVSEVEALYIPTDNTAASSTETIANICDTAGIPIIAGEEGICEDCGIATLSISYYDIGYKTGEMAYDILVNGADVSTMDIAYAPEFVKKYVPERCEALGITIPDDYEAIGADAEAEAETQAETEAES